MENDVKVKSLGKAISILECFTTERPELGITEIAQMMSLNKSNVHNIITTFEKLGYIVKNPETNRYSLGIKLLQFSYIINNHIGYHKLFLPCMKQITEKTNETVFLGIPYGKEVLYLDSCMPNGAVPMRNIMGERAPMYCTGLGKAMLAYSDSPEDLLPETLKPYTKYTITDKGLLLDHLQTIRQQGYALDNMEHEYGIRCVGIAVSNRNHQIVAGLSVSGPSLRFEGENVQKFAAIMKEIVDQIQI